MKPLAVPLALPSSLVALDRALGEGGASALDPEVPRVLWQRALAGPAREFLTRPGKELRAQIVHAGWLLGGGAAGAVPGRLSLVLEILHAGSLIVDDVEDASEGRRGMPALHHLVGVPLAINTGTWMYFWALAELGELGLPQDHELVAHKLAIATLVRCHQGQALDLATRIDALDAAHVPHVVEAVSRLKTGTLCRFAAELGALSAGASEHVRAAIGRFGETAGITLQMLDDLGAIASPARREKGREDLRAARPTWPWAWLAECEPFVWARLTAMARSVAGGEGDPDALADALAALVAEPGRARVHARLAKALDELTAAVGAVPGIDSIAADLRRMEASYG